MRIIPNLIIPLLFVLTLSCNQKSLLDISELSPFKVTISQTTSTSDPNDPGLIEVAEFEVHDIDTLDLTGSNAAKIAISYESESRGIRHGYFGTIVYFMRGRAGSKDVLEASVLASQRVGSRYSSFTGDIFAFRIEDPIDPNSSFLAFTGIEKADTLVIDPNNTQFPFNILYHISRTELDSLVDSSSSFVISLERNQISKGVVPFVLIRLRGQHCWFGRTLPNDPIFGFYIGIGTSEELSDIYVGLVR